MATYELTETYPSSIITGDVITCEYSGASKQLTLPKGIYIFECYGAQGGASMRSYAAGGLGGYSKGTIRFNEEANVYLNVGGKGMDGSVSNPADGNGGYNGGGSCIAASGGGGGGGGTDICLTYNTINDRIIVAGGGGGGAYFAKAEGYAAAVGGTGGGNTGGNGGVDHYGDTYALAAAEGGTQTSGGAGAEITIGSTTGGDGSLFYGGDSSSGTLGFSGGGGGGGYYGGGGGVEFSGASAKYGIAGGAGGSGYLSSDFTDTSSSNGVRSGNGYIKITAVSVGGLTPPQNFKVSSIKEFSVVLTWDSVEDAQGYRLYRNGNVIAQEISGTTFTDSQLTENTTYEYSIIALAEDPEENSEASVITVTTLDITPLDAPTNFRAVNITGNSVTLGWNAVAGTQIYRISRNGTVIGQNVTGTSFTDTGLTGYTTYSYSIIAVYSGKEQYNSSAVTISVTTTLPAPVFEKALVSETLFQNMAAKALDGTATAQLGTLTYQWQESSESASWQNIAGETGATFTPPTEEIGTTFYRVIATTTYSGKTASAESNIAEITVEAAGVPIFDNPLLSATYDLGETAVPLLGYAKVINGSVSYQWYESGDGVNFDIIAGATEATYTPLTAVAGTKYYYVMASNTVEGLYYQSKSNVAVITVINFRNTSRWKNLDYRQQLRKPFVKLCRLRFLQPDGSTAFALDNNPKNKFSRAFIEEGQISVNLQNGRRRTATVTIANVDARFDYDVNKIWFGQEIALDEGLYLSDGTEFYIQQGIFLIETPNETVEPNRRTVTYNLVDKWANLDGTLFGNLEGTYEVTAGTNIFKPIAAMLSFEKGNGYLLDRIKPIFTEYYNNLYQELPDGTLASLSTVPYTLTINSEDGTYGDVILELAAMLNAWVGYDSAGALRIEPSQDDILDSNKPVLWQFSQEETQLLGLSYTVKNTEVFNDYIVIGEMLEDYKQPSGRAQNLDPSSDTNVNIIGRKTKRVHKAGYGTDRMCVDFAVWKLKRSAVLQKAVNISCSQIMHIKENELVTVVRTDKPGNPVERHLVQGFTRPLASAGAMTISCVSVNDFPIATVTNWPE